MGATPDTRAIAWTDAEAVVCAVAGFAINTPKAKITVRAAKVGRWKRDIRKNLQKQ
jgi:hypothetical protein